MYNSRPWTHDGSFDTNWYLTLKESILNASSKFERTKSLYEPHISPPYDWFEAKVLYFTIKP